MKVGKILATENRYGQNKASLSPDYMDEVINDKWDVRVLGIPYNTGRADYQLSFEKIPDQFRELVKKFVRQRLLELDSISWATARQDVHKLNIFFKFISGKYPEWTNLNELTRNDMEDYFAFIRNNPMGGDSPSKYRGQDPTDYYIWNMVGNVENFLYFLQRYDWKEAPAKPIRALVYQEDRPKLQPRKLTEYKYITDYVWNQVVDNISQLVPQYIPIILVMEATGFHLNNVLLLKLDCLIDEEDGYWVKSEKWKNRTHKVPISDDIANIIKAQQELMNEKFPGELNPKSLLFLRYKGKANSIGKSFVQSSILRNLNKVASSCNITDENGQIYHFGGLAFRHRYGLSLINNGMSILDVQRFIANVTPEMAVIYAKIHDFTLQIKWEESQSLSSIRLDPQSGKVIATELDKQAFENGIKLDWLRRNISELRLDHGYCIKPPRVSCQYSNQMLENPCISFNCSSFYVDETFIDYYNEQIKITEKHIEECRKTNRFRNIGILEPKLKKYIEIRNGLEGSGI